MLSKDAVNSMDSPIGIYRETLATPLTLTLTVAVTQTLTVVDGIISLQGA